MALRSPTRGATALLTLAVLALTACSTTSAPADTAPPVETTQPPTSETLTFVAPDRSPNTAYGLTADGPERVDSSGPYRQAEFAEDSAVFEFSPEVVYEDVRGAFSAADIAAAQRAAATFFIREYIDSEVVADSSESVRADLVERLRDQVTDDPSWGTPLVDLIAEPGCSRLVDCSSTTRVADLDYTLTPGTDLRFILSSFTTTGIWLGDDDSIVVALAAAYKRELTVPGSEHAFESLMTDAVYSLKQRDENWIIDAWQAGGSNVDVLAFVEGGYDNLPVYADVDWGTIPPGFTEHDFAGVHFAVSPAWEPGGDEQWSWYGRTDDEEVQFDAFLGPVLDITGTRADLAVVLEPEDTDDDSPETSDPEASYPLNGAAYRLEIPGAGEARASIRPDVTGRRDRVDIWLEAGDQSVWFITYAEPGEGEARFHELVQTVTIA